jgi:hypothetical protein
MPRTIWEWIVSMDDRINDAMIDAAIAIALSAVATTALRLLLDLL